MIRLRQEDLWVYKTLLQVIRETNNEGDPEHPVTCPTSNASNGSKSAPMQSVPGRRRTNRFSRPVKRRHKPHKSARCKSCRHARDAAAAAQDSKEQLLKDRYVDDKGVPLDADAKQPYSEFKMMPISMKLLHGSA